MIGVGVGLSTIDVAARDMPSAGSLSVGPGSGGLSRNSCGCARWLHRWAAFRKGISIDHRLSRAACVGRSTLIVVYLLSSAASGLVGGALSTASSALGAAGKAIGGSIQSAVQTAAPSLNNMSDPMGTIENKVRSASGGQDPAALRDAAATAVRAALTGDPAQQAAATDKAADALAKAQNIPPDQAKAQVEQYQQQFKETVGQAKEQAKQAADTTAKTVSRAVL